MKTDLQKRKRTILLANITGALLLISAVGVFILDDHFSINNNALINRHLEEEESRRLMDQVFLPEAGEGGWMNLEEVGLTAMNDQYGLLLNNGKRESRLYSESLLGLTPEGNLLTLYSSEKLGDRHKLWDGRELSAYLGISNSIIKFGSPLSLILILLWIIFSIRRLIFRIRFGKLKNHSKTEKSTEAKPVDQPAVKPPVKSQPSARTPKKQYNEKDINNPDPGIRKSAVYNIKDQEILKKLGLSDVDEDVRAAAVKRITNKEFRQKMARTDISPHVRLAAIKDLEDYRFTASRIKEDPDRQLQRKAVRFCKDNTLLTDLYNTHPDPEVRQAAFQRIQPNEDNARWVFEKTNDKKIKKIALALIRDESFLEKQLLDSDDYDICLIAGSGISEEKLTMLFPQIKNRAAQKGLLDKISSFTARKSLIRPEIPADIISEVFKTLPEEEQPVLLDDDEARLIFEAIEEDEPKREIFKQIKDTSYLEKILQESRDYVICLDAGSRIQEERLIALYPVVRNEYARQDLIKKSISEENKLSLLTQSLPEKQRKELLNSFSEERLFTLIAESSLPEDVSAVAVDLITKKELIWEGNHDSRLSDSLRERFENRADKSMRIEWIKSKEISREQREKLLANLPDDDLYSVLGSDLDEEVIKRIESFAPYGWFECSHYSPGMESATCSDNDCYCGGTSYPKGEGYLFISRLCAHFRRDYPGEMEIQSHANANYGKGMFAPPSEAFNAVFLCEKAAKRRGLDLEIAAKDAKIWWQTEKGPCRSTPIVKTFSKEEDPNSSVNMNPLMFKTMFGNPLE